MDNKFLKVDHNLETIPEGQDIILTLQDTNVLDEEGNDVLENLNMQEKHRRERNKEKKKELEQNAQHYKEKYDQDRNILSKYDEEEKEREGFGLTYAGDYIKKKQEKKEIPKNTFDCTAGEKKLQEEFEQIKIKKKIKKVKAQVVRFEEDEGTQDVQVRSEFREEFRRKVMEEDEDQQLQDAINKQNQKQLRIQRQNNSIIPEQEQIISQIQQEQPISEEDKEEEQYQEMQYTIDKIKDKQLKLLPSEITPLTGPKRKTSSEEENDLSFIYHQENNQGVSAVMQRLRQRGDLNQNELIIGRGTDNKSNEFDDKKQEVNLEYRDEQGRLMTPKEAFRYMCRIFHGKKPSRNNLEKRQKYQQLKEQSQFKDKTILMKALENNQQRTQQAHMVLKNK